MVRRHDSDFDEASELFNPRFDGVRPLAVVEATSAHDVSEAIGFATSFGLPVRPKSGGHSYVGASTVADGVVIDVSRIAAVRYHADDRTATVGAGAKLYDVHAALADDGRTYPTGTCPTVGAVGLTLGGGIGVASRQYGLTCDQLAAVTIVTADGETRKASARQEEDLFWACRGGGGGNVGIVTSLRMHTQPARRTGFFLLTFPWTQARQVLAGWARRMTTAQRSTWSNLHLEAGSDGSTTIRVVGVTRAGDQDAEADAMESEAGVGASSRSTFERGFLDGVEFLGGGTTSSRQAFAAGSDILADMTPGVARALVRVVEQRAASGRGVAAILDPLTGAVSDVADDDSAFPWRDHLCDIQWYVDLSGNTSGSAARAAYSWINTAHDALGSHSVGGYINYLEPHRSIAAYYGSNYSRLKAIKSSIDPSGVFHSPYTVS